MTLTVWTFDSADGAERSAAVLQRLGGSELELYDAATVRWDAGARGPSGRPVKAGGQISDPSRDFWGMFFGLVFYVPLLGAAVGAVEGAFSGSLTDVGIDANLVNKVRDAVTPGTSALFTMSSDPAVAEIEAMIDGDEHRPDVLRTHVALGEQAVLRELFCA